MPDGDSSPVALVTGAEAGLVMPSREACRVAVYEVLGTWSRLDCLVNCAGILRIAPAEAISEAARASTLSIHFGGGLRAAQAASGGARVADLYARSRSSGRRRGSASPRSRPGT